MNPEYLQKYEDEMRAKKQQQEAAADRADTTNEIERLREQLRQEKNRLDRMHGKIKEVRDVLRELTIAVERDPLYNASGIRVDFSELTQAARMMWS